MSIEEHYQEFARVINENGLDEPAKAEEISEYLTTGKVKVTDFASKFGLSEEDAKVFLEFVMKGIKFKEKHIDGR